MQTLIPSEAWKKNRDRIARRMRNGLHTQETNPGPEFRLRYDYVATRAEITKIVEEVMLDTERLCMYYTGKNKA